MDTVCEPDASDGVPFEAPWGHLGRDFTLGVVSLASKFLLNVLNSTDIHNGDTLQKQATERPPGVGLLTVCNHTRWDHRLCLKSSQVILGFPFPFQLLMHNYHTIDVYFSRHTDPGTVPTQRCWSGLQHHR